MIPSRCDCKWTLLNGGLLALPTHHSTAAMQLMTAPYQQARAYLSSILYILNCHLLHLQTPQHRAFCRQGRPSQCQQIPGCGVFEDIANAA